MVWAKKHKELSDKNYISHSDENGVLIENQFIIPPVGTRWDDALKFSHCNHIRVTNCAITGGSEDAIDLNRNCFVGEFTNNHITSRGEYGVTIKGGCSGILFSDCVFYGKPSSGYDIDLGNWSDQSDELTRHIALENLTRADGKPVRVRVLWADKPLVAGGNVKVVTYPRILVKIYRFFRRLF